MEGQLAAAEGKLEDVLARLNKVRLFTSARHLRKPCWLQGSPMLLRWQFSGTPHQRLTSDEQFSCCQTNSAEEVEWCALNQFQQVNQAQQTFLAGWLSHTRSAGTQYKLVLNSGKRGWRYRTFLTACQCCLAIYSNKSFSSRLDSAQRYG